MDGWLNEEWVEGGMDVRVSGWMDGWWKDGNGRMDSSKDKSYRSRHIVEWGISLMVPQFCCPQPLEKKAPGRRTCRFFSFLLAETPSQRCLVTLRRGSPDHINLQGGNRHISGLQLAYMSQLKPHPPPSCLGPFVGWLIETRIFTKVTSKYLWRQPQRVLALERRTFEYQPQHVLAMWFRASSFTSLNLSVHIIRPACGSVEEGGA